MCIDTNPLNYSVNYSPGQVVIKVPCGPIKKTVKIVLERQDQKKPRMERVAIPRLPYQIVVEPKKLAKALKISVNEIQTKIESNEENIFNALIIQFSIRETQKVSLPILGTQLVSAQKKGTLCTYTWEDGKTRTVQVEDTDVVGYGAFKVVYKGIDQKSRKCSFAVTCHAGSTSFHSPAEEARKMIELRSAGVKVCKVYKALKFPFNDIEDKYVIIGEFCDGKFIEFWDSGSPAERLKVFKDLAASIAMMNSGQNCIHRDIKPDNILMSQKDEIRITDLGLYSDAKSRDFLRHAGTKQFYCPEYLLQVINKDDLNEYLTSVRTEKGMNLKPDGSISEYYAFHGLSALKINPLGIDPYSFALMMLDLLGRYQRSSDPLEIFKAQSQVFKELNCSLKIHQILHSLLLPDSAKRKSMNDVMSLINELTEADMVECSFEVVPLSEIYDSLVKREVADEIIQLFTSELNKGHLLSSNQIGFYKDIDDLILPYVVNKKCTEFDLLNFIREHFVEDLSSLENVGLLRELQKYQAYIRPDLTEVSAVQELHGLSENYLAIISSVEGFKLCYKMSGNLFLSDIKFEDSRFVFYQDFDKFINKFSPLTDPFRKLSTYYRPDLTYQEAENSLKRDSTIPYFVLVPLLNAYLALYNQANDLHFKAIVLSNNVLMDGHDILDIEMIKKVFIPL